jgi:hypothetical protein
MKWKKEEERREEATDPTEELFLHSFVLPCHVLSHLKGLLLLLFVVLLDLLDPCLQLSFGS